VRADEAHQPPVHLAGAEMSGTIAIESSNPAKGIAHAIEREAPWKAASGATAPYAGAATNVAVSANAKKSVRRYMPG
jgi:hypothetical protein